MESLSRVPEFLANALAAIDRAATVAPHTPTGRDLLVSELGVARQSVRAAIKEFTAVGGGSQSVTRYLEDSRYFVDELDAAAQIWYIVAPLPIVRRVNSSTTTSEAFNCVIEDIVATINDGHINDPWMHPGDLEWAQHDDFIEISIVPSRQRRSQRLIMNNDGVIAVCDRVIPRAPYSVSRYEAMLEVTMECSARLINRFNMRTAGVAVLTRFVNAEKLRMGIMEGTGQAWLRPSKPLSRFFIPSKPIETSVEGLRSPRRSVESIGRALVAASVVEYD